MFRNDSIENNRNGQKLKKVLKTKINYVNIKKINFYKLLMKQDRKL